MKVIQTVILGLTLIVVGCKKEESIEDLGPTKQVVFQDYNGSVSLPSLEGTHNEIWFQDDSGTNYSIGTYEHGENGSDGELYFDVPESIINSAVKVIVTIESDNESDGTPSNYVYSSGEFSKDAYPNLIYFGSEFDYCHPTDFSGTMTNSVCFTYEYFDNDGTTSFGVWLTQGNCNSTNTDNFELIPILESSGYSYEAWVEYNGENISLGKFLDPLEEDFASSYHQEGTGGNVPGERFVENIPAIMNEPRTSLHYFITLEPYPDLSTDPYYVVYGPSPIPMPQNPQLPASGSGSLSTNCSSMGQCNIYVSE